MVKVSTDGCRLQLGSREIELNHVVRKAIKHDETVIVLLEVTDETHNRNVLGFSTEGDRMWRVDPPESSSIYTGLTERNGDVRVVDYAGNSYILDVFDGSTEFHKWGK